LRGAWAQAGRADVGYYRDMVTIIRDRVQDYKYNKKMTLNQVKSSVVTTDYDRRWANASGDWTRDVFIEAVYNTVTENNEQEPGVKDEAHVPLQPARQPDSGRICLLADKALRGRH
jgi:hypothetical protein